MFALNFRGRPHAAGTGKPAEDGMPPGATEAQCQAQPMIFSSRSSVYGREAKVRYLTQVRHTRCVLEKCTYL